jgi:hypothetical protein
MKKNIVQLLSWSLSLIALIALVAAINFALSLRPQGSSQGNDIRTLEERLVQLGIPVKSVTVTKQSPLEIEVILQSSGSDEKLSQDDLWNKFLTEREVELAYLNFTTHIESYRLVLVTAKGNTIYDSTVFLYPGLPSQKLTQAPPSSVDNSKTKDILERSLDLQGLQLLALDVPSSHIASDNSMLVTLDLSTGTSADKIDIAQIDEFIMKVRPQIEEINSRYETRIVLIRIRIKDFNDKLLVDYMEDIETGRQYSWTAENIEGNWYPQPAPAISSEPQETPMTVVPPTATSPKSTALPTTTTQSAAYTPPPTSNPYPYP